MVCWSQCHTQPDLIWGKDGFPDSSAGSSEEMDPGWEKSSTWPNGKDWQGMEVDAWLF